MDLTTIVLLSAVTILAFYLVIIYNNLVRLKHNITKARSNIDVSLKQRHDELPKLVSACKKYMEHERGTLEAVIKARNSVAEAQHRDDIKALGMAETSLRKGLGKLFALAENYPQLKAESSFQQLQQRISHLEEVIADRRELYNESVNLNNIRIEQFPDVIVARNLGFKHFDMLMFSATEIADVNLNQLFDA